MYPHAAEHVRLPPIHGQHGKRRCWQYAPPSPSSFWALWASAGCGSACDTTRGGSGTHPPVTVTAETSDETVSARVDARNVFFSTGLRPIFPRGRRAHVGLTVTNGWLCRRRSCRDVGSWRTDVEPRSAQPGDHRSQAAGRAERGGQSLRTEYGAIRSCTACFASSPRIVMMTLSGPIDAVDPRAIFSTFLLAAASQSPMMGRMFCAGVLSDPEREQGAVG